MFIYEYKYLRINDYLVKYIYPLSKNYNPSLTTYIVVSMVNYY
jgi:hypothetical protein